MDRTTMTTQSAFSALAALDIGQLTKLQQQVTTFEEIDSDLEMRQSLRGLDGRVQRRGSPTPGLKKKLLVQRDSSMCVIPNSPQTITAFVGPFGRRLTVSTTKPLDGLQPGSPLPATPLSFPSRKRNSRLTPFQQKKEHLSVKVDQRTGTVEAPPRSSLGRKSSPALIDLWATPSGKDETPQLQSVADI